MADASWFAMVRERLEPCDKTEVSVNHQPVQVNHRTRLFSFEQRVVEVAGEDSGCVLLERVEPTGLLLPVVDIGTIAPCISEALANSSEVGSLVAGASVAHWISEGLYEQHRVPVGVDEVRRKPVQYPRQHSRGEVWPALASKHAESLVVRHKAQPAELHLRLPADVAVSRTKTQSRRPEANHSDNTFVFESDVAHDLAD